MAEIKKQQEVLQSQIDAANSTNTKSSAEMDELKKQLEESQAELKTTSAELDITKKTLGEKETEYAGACVKNEARVTELEQLNEKLKKTIEEAEKKNFNSEMSIIQLLEHYIKRYEEFQEKIKSATPAGEDKPDKGATINVGKSGPTLKDKPVPELTGKSTPELKDESATVIKGESTSKPKDESATSKLDKDKSSSSSGKKEL